MIAFSMRRPRRGATEGHKQHARDAMRQFVPHNTRVAGGADHSAQSTEECPVLDVFQPVREDYWEFTAAASSTRVTEVGQ